MFSLHAWISSFFLFFTPQEPSRSPVDPRLTQPTPRLPEETLLLHLDDNLAVMETITKNQQADDLTGS